MKKVFLCLMMAFVFHSAQAQNQNINNKKHQLHAIQSKIADLDKKLKSSRNKRLLLTKELDKSNTTLRHLSSKEKIYQLKYHQKQNQLVHLTEETQSLQNKLNRQKSLLQKHIQARYRLGMDSDIKFFLNQENPAHLSQILHYYRYVKQAHHHYMNQIKSALVQLANNKQQIAINTKQLYQNTQLLKKQERKIKQSQQFRQFILERLNKDIHSRHTQRNRLMADEAALEKVIKQLTGRKHPAFHPRVPFKNKQHQLPWPIKGRINTHFGDSIEGNLKSNGVTLVSRQNQAVHAIYSGRIIFSNYLRGFGLLLIIDHGHGTMSLYGHNQILYKKEGNTVKAGEIIGTISKPEKLVKNGLYFEIRDKGKPLNPEAWCNNKYTSFD